MFEKFGEFDSAEEINRAAIAQRAQGDHQAVYDLAEENGLDREDAEDFLEGIIDDLATPITAAEGKLRKEIEEYKLEGILRDWAMELIEMCILEKGNKSLVTAIRRKGKGLDGYIAALAGEGYANRVTVDRRIVDKAPEIKKICGSHEFAIGVPDKRARKRIAKEYYLGGAE